MFSIDQIREFFKDQLDFVEPHDGDYLGAGSFDETVDYLMAMPGWQLTRERTAEHVRDMIAEYARHAGEKQVFVMVRSISEDGPKCQIQQWWESELIELADHTFDRYHDTGGPDLPIFIHPNAVEFFTAQVQVNA